MKALSMLAAASILVLTACGSQPGIPGTKYGSARLLVDMSEGRSVQYVAGDIQGARVTLYGSTNGGAYSELAHVDFTGAGLASHLSSNAFSFTVDNLKVSDTLTTYSYQTKVETFLESTLTTSLGSSTSNGFTVTASQTPTTITMPGLRLLATPVGSGSSTVTIIDTPAPVVVIR